MVRHTARHLPVRQLSGHFLFVSVRLAAGNLCHRQIFLRQKACKTICSISFILWRTISFGHPFVGSYSDWL